MEETLWEEYTYYFEKKPGIGFGMAISGGRDNPNAVTGDPAIIVSDVIKNGPAFNKLKTGDIILRVNGKPMFNVEHSKAIKEMKNSGQRVELTIRRKIVVRVDTPPPGRLSRSRSRDLDSLPRRYSRSPDDRGRYRSRSRDRDDRYRRHRSRSRDLDSDRYRDRSYRRSRSRTPPRRGRSYSRSPSYSRHRSRTRSPSYRRGRSRTRSPSDYRGRSRTRSRTPSRRSRNSFTPSSRSASSPPSRDSPPPRLEKHKSVEDLRRSGSPLSPDPDNAIRDDKMMILPVKKPEPKTVVLKKTRWNNSYGLKLGTRIFIQDIQPGSLADKSFDISAGDTVLMINGRNVDNKTVPEAIQVIGLSKDKVTMLIRKEDGGTVSLPASHFAAHASRDPVESESEGDNKSSSRRSSFSKASERIEEPVEASKSPEVLAKSDKKQFGGVRVLPRNLTGPAASSTTTSTRSSPEPAPRSNHATLDREYSLPPADEDDDEPPVLPPTARQITFRKGKNVGIRLTGGNDVGIFVASVLDGTPAARQGLKTGDQILSVNDVNFRNIIREEAVLTLMGLPAGEEVRVVSQPQPEVYKKIIERGTGDSFYVRTHFKYDKSGNHEMSFKRGSTFRISDTLYQGMVGYWLAVRIGRNNMEIERGVIPNSSRAEQLKMVQDKKIATMKEHRNRGIGRRFKNHKPDNPQAASASTIFPAYERIVLREAGFKRPVVVFGPLADIARERLAGDYPNLYEIARNEGTVSGQKSNRKGVIRLNTIKDVIEKDMHAILDITPNAVEKLNYAQLYPIVVYLEAQSKNVVKDLRGKLATTDEEKKKKPGKLYDRSSKLQRGYNHVFTDTIKLTASSDDWYRKLYSTIRDQQSMPVWVSEDKLGPAGDAEEGVMVPGDDDQLSYVSAPASDYSVTTIGSDMLNRSRMSDEEEPEAATIVPPARPPSSSSSSEEEEEEGEKFEDDDFGDLGDSDEAAPPVEKPVSPPATTAPPYISKASSKQSLPYQPRPVVRSSSSSSSSSEEEPPIPTITPAPPGVHDKTTIDSPRRVTEIPEGRFDPKSFLDSHIGGLRKSSPEKTNLRPAQPSYSAPAPIRNQPSREESPAPKPSSYSPAPVAKSEPQQPVYAQVNKVRPATQTDAPDTRRDSSVRDYAREIDNFMAEPYKKPLVADKRFSKDEMLTRHVSPPQPKPANTYNRFAGSQLKTEPKPYQPYNPPKPTYQRPSATNGAPQKSKFVQEQYKEYMSQIRPSVAGSSYASNPRPYKPPSKVNNTSAPKSNPYNNGVETMDAPISKRDPIPVSPNIDDDDDPQVVATARGFFDSNGGVLSSVETGVSIVIPKGAIRPGTKQEIYFKVCRDNTALPPLDKNKGETLLSPLVMCGPHGLQFDHPVELRLPHCASMTSDGWSFALKTSDPGEPSQWHNVGAPNESNNYDVSSNNVSVLIDHF